MKENVVRLLFAVYKTNIYFLDLKVYIGPTPFPPSLRFVDLVKMLKIGDGPLPYFSTVSSLEMVT